MTALVPYIVSVSDGATGLELSRLEKLLILEQHLAERFDATGPGVQTAVLSKEMRECWLEIEELSDVDASGSDAEDDSSGMHERIAEARRRAEAAAREAG